MAWPQEHLLERFTLSFVLGPGPFLHNLGLGYVDSHSLLIQVLQPDLKAILCDQVSLDASRYESCF